MLGQVVDGKYEILRLLGEGGMGAVYEARHRATSRLVALKVISSDDVRANDTLIARFEREAQAAAKVRSPHIVEIFDAGHDASTGHPYMVMELLVGMNVHRLLRQLGPLPPELAVRIAVQTCFGLDKAHAAGVVHRDIKPANLFLSESDGGEQVVKLLDFGVAKFKMDQASEAGLDGLTRTGSVLGSPMYMSPEQARGLKTIDHRADIWSLGIVLYQLLSGKTPHAGIDGVGELIITICSEEPEPLRKRAPWISPRLEAVVHGALKLSAAERYQSASAMQAALLQCLADPTRWHVAKADLVALTDADRSARPGDAPVAAADDEDRATVALDVDQVPVAPAPRPVGGAGGDDGATMALEPEQLGAGAAASLPFARAPQGDGSAGLAPAPGGAGSRWNAGKSSPAPAAASPGPAPRPARSEPASVDTLSGHRGRKSGGTKAFLAVGIGIGIGIAAVALYFGKREGAPAPPPGSAAHDTVAVPVSAAASVPAIDPVPPPTATAQAGNRVKIVPPQAAVAIDGKRANKDAEGYVTLDGPVGTKRVFTVLWQGRPTVRTVVLGAAGPEPAEIVAGSQVVGGPTPAVATSAPTSAPEGGHQPKPPKSIDF